MRSFASQQIRGATAIGVLLLLGAATALAASKPSSTATITVKASVTFKPNQYLQLNDHYSPGTITIASCGTITLKNTDTEAHSLSLVKRSDMPRTVNQVNNCPVCGPLFQRPRHQPERAAPNRAAAPSCRQRRRARLQHTRRLDPRRTQGPSVQQGDVQGDRQAWHDALLHLHLPSLDAGEADRQVEPDMRRLAGRPMSSARRVRPPSLQVID